MYRETIPVVRKSPLTDQVVQELTKQILSGALAPGTSLKQGALAQQLTVSRTPLREAMRVLLADGLLLQHANGTFTVIAPTLEDARDTYELREVIDGFAARMASIRATEDEIDELERLVILIEATCEPFNASQYLEAVTNFHIGLLRASSNKAMLGLETTIRVSTRVLYPKFALRKDRLLAAAHEHRMLCDAIKARDPVSAEQLAQSHVRNVIKFWIDNTDENSST